MSLSRTASRRQTPSRQWIGAGDSPNGITKISRKRKRPASFAPGQHRTNKLQAFARIDVLAEESSNSGQNESESGSEWENGNVAQESDESDAAESQPLSEADELVDKTKKERRRRCTVPQCKSWASRKGGRCGTHALEQKCRDEGCEVTIRSFDGYCASHRPCRKSKCHRKVFKRRFCKQHYQDHFSKTSKGGARTVAVTDEEILLFFKDQLENNVTEDKIVLAVRKEKKIGYGRAKRLLSELLDERKKIVKFVVAELRSSRAGELCPEILSTKFGVAEAEAGKLLMEGVLKAALLAQTLYRKRHSSAARERVEDGTRPVVETNRGPAETSYSPSTRKSKRGREDSLGPESPGEDKEEMASSSTPSPRQLERRPLSQKSSSFLSRSSACSIPFDGVAKSVSLREGIIV